MAEPRMSRTDDSGDFAVFVIHVSMDESARKNIAVKGTASFLGGAAPGTVEAFARNSRSVRAVRRCWTMAANAGGILKTDVPFPGNRNVPFPLGGFEGWKMPVAVTRWAVEPGESFGW